MKTIFSLLALTFFGLSPVLAQDAEEETEAAAEQPAAEPVPEDADRGNLRRQVLRCVDFRPADYDGYVRQVRTRWRGSGV